MLYDTVSTHKKVTCSFLSQVSEAADRYFGERQWRSHVAITISSKYTTAMFHLKQLPC